MDDSIVIVYDTRTGNSRRFSKKTGLPMYFLRDIPRNVDKFNKKYVLVTYTDNLGEVPATTQEFLNIYSENMIGVAVSGNRNWGINFAKAADIISSQYNVPILLKFELLGTKDDVKNFMKGIDELCQQN